MFFAALAIAIASYSVIAGTYASYYFFVLRNPRTKDYVRLIKQTVAKPLPCEDLPEVTAIIPMHNEESVISKKLQNLAELDYSIEKIQVVLVDDCSTDMTCEVAQRVIIELGLNGMIVRNPQRMGANASYNVGVASANNSLILRTDADVILNPDSLRKAIQIISSNEEVGAVTGMMDPVYDIKTPATMMEKQYRNLFDRMSVAESALHSTYPGGGGFTLIKKSVFSAIPINQGSTDGNISLSIIRNGFRHIYVPESFSFELVSKRLGDQMRQKVRRARRVIQSTIMNRDILFNRKYREFGMLIFPLRFSMFVISPFLIFSGVLSTFFLLFSYSPILASSAGLTAFLLFLLGAKTHFGLLNLVTSALTQQFYLVLGLFLLPKRNSIWESMGRPKQLGSN